MKLTSIKADRSPLTADRESVVSGHNSQVSGQRQRFDLRHETCDLRPILAVTGKHLTVNILYQTRSGAGRGE